MRTSSRLRRALRRAQGGKRFGRAPRPELGPKAHRRGPRRTAQSSRSDFDESFDQLRAASGSAELTVEARGEPLSRLVETLGRFKRWGSPLYFALLRFLLPAWCAVCHGPLGTGSRSVVCGACWGGIRILEPPFCPRCGRPFWGSTLAHPPSHRCQACRTRAPQYFLARSAVLYDRDDPLREILLLFKHGRRIALGPHLGLLMATRVADLFDGHAIDTIVPVPLHRGRERERGFNQADILARVVGKRLRRPVLRRTLERIRPTPPQAGKARDRARNVRGAFAVRDPGRIDGRSLLLVDDVLTTGATVNECAKVLMKAGARTVLVYTLARAL